MALAEIANAPHALSISDPEYLLFNPIGDWARLREKFDEVHLYLFRVFTPNSRGTTDQPWTKSMDAADGTQNSKMDIFARENNRQVASMLNRHLQWWEGNEDNLVSWTRSLLFALVYVFHLHANNRDRSAFDDIYLRIIDTMKFPKAAFLRDIDLIEVYFRHDNNLEYFKGLRMSNFYFGEYLSQGALKIEDKFRIVLAQATIDQGLYDLRCEFKDFARWKSSRNPPWVRPVIDLRRILYQIERPEKSEAKLRVAFNIAQLFGPHWTLPVAANLGALLPPPEEDIAIIQTFRADIFTGSPVLSRSKLKLIYLDDDRENSSPSRLK